MTTVIPATAEQATATTPAPEATTAPAPAPITVQFKPCGCGVLVGEWCDCLEFLAGIDAAPSITFGGAW